METDCSRLWRVRRTVMQMLKARDYLVNDEDLTMNLTQFKNKFTENPNRDALVYSCRKVNDPTDKIFVFFAKDEKVGVKPVRDIAKRMEDEGVSRAILIVIEGITPFARTALHEFGPDYNIELFSEIELLVNITEHVLVPKHVLLTDTQKANLLSRYKCTADQLPRIQLTDPISRFYGVRRGQVFKIIRNSETAGRYVTYRLVV